MKIIATVNEETFIAEVSAEELARLREPQAKDAEAPPVPVVGSQIDVTHRLNRLVSLESREGELRRLSAALRTQADLLESLAPQIKDAVAAPPGPPRGGRP